MTKNQNFIETKEYKRFAEFCDACIKYQYISILVYVMVNLVSEKLYRLGITQIGILLKNKLTIEVGKI